GCYFKFVEPPTLEFIRLALTCLTRDDRLCEASSCRPLPSWMRLGTDLAAAGARTRNPSRMMRGVDVPKPSSHQLVSEQVLPGDAMSILLRVQEPYRKCSGSVRI